MREGIQKMRQQQKGWQQLLLHQRLFSRLRVVYGMILFHHHLHQMRSQARRLYFEVKFLLQVARQGISECISRDS